MLSNLVPSSMVVHRIDYLKEEFVENYFVPKKRNEVTLHNQNTTKAVTDRSSAAGTVCASIFADMVR